MAAAEYTEQLRQMFSNVLEETALLAAIRSGEWVVAIVLYAILGKLADILARQLESVWLRWHPAYQKKQGDAA